MIIPKQYGGLGFSATAHSRVIAKLASISSTLSSTVGVPNSLGPGELLLHYGTDEQKNHYLPRLADGREIPCFALTGPSAGSDATSIPDYGIVCEGEWNGAKVARRALTFDKRYITLAPVATVIGLAFRLYDPDGLLGEKPDRGITLALMPRGTPGLEVGRRHLPLNCTFQNGPVKGKGVFVPLSQFIGGRTTSARAGACWSSACPWAAPSRCPPPPAAACRWGRWSPARMHASASSSVSRSAASKAWKKPSRALLAMPMPAARCRRPPPRRWIAARNRPCPRPLRNTTAPSSHAKWRATRWTCTAARA
jgi:hypothetical protein